MFQRGATSSVSLRLQLQCCSLSIFRRHAAQKNIAPLYRTWLLVLSLCKQVPEPKDETVKEGFLMFLSFACFGALPLLGYTVRTHIFAHTHHPYASVVFRDLRIMHEWHPDGWWMQVLSGALYIIIIE